MAQDGRRRFLEGLMLLAAGTAAATVLGGCAAEPASADVGPIEEVPLRPGMHHFNMRPARIASVRTYDLPRIVSQERVTTKADRI
jgi:hypothetical protein